MLGWLSTRVFLGATQLRMARRGVPAFAYHKIGPAASATIDPFLYVSQQNFEEQLTALAAAGLTSAQPGEAVAGQNASHLKVVITFDDGCCNVFQNSLEPLARHKFHAIQFLVSSFLGKKNQWDISKGDCEESLMDETQVREWLAAGHAIGSHTSTHRNLRRISTNEAREEIAGSKKTLEDRFGLAVDHFCYPYGSWNESIRDMVEEAGYRTACTMDFGVNMPSTNRFELQRIIPLSSMDLLRKVLHRVGRRIRGT